MRLAGLRAVSTSLFICTQQVWSAAVKMPLCTTGDQWAKPWRPRARRAAPRTAAGRSSFKVAATGAAAATAVEGTVVAARGTRSFLGFAAAAGAHSFLGFNGLGAFVGFAVSPFVSAALRRLWRRRRPKHRAAGNMQPSQASAVFSIATFNLRGVSDRWVERQPLLRQCLHQMDADVLCFQECLTGERVGWCVSAGLWGGYCHSAAACSPNGATDSSAALLCNAMWHACLCQVDH